MPASEPAASAASDKVRTTLPVESGDRLWICRQQLSRVRRKDGEGMTGMQKTAYEAVKEVAANILSGKYGKDDDIDIDALEDDLEDATADLG